MSKSGQELPFKPSAPIKLDAEKSLKDKSNVLKM